MPSGKKKEDMYSGVVKDFYNKLFCFLPVFHRGHLKLSFKATVKMALVGKTKGCTDLRKRFIGVF